MIAIYRGEDTCFAGAEPITIRLDTELDLTGFTAELLFGSIVKDFGTEDVGRKELPLSFTAAETATLFPGKGYAVVKVYDTEGRVAILKKFVIDVRMRKADGHIDAVDVAEAIATFDEIRKDAAAILTLTEEDDTAAVKAALNSFLSAARRRGEFTEVIPLDGCGFIPPSSVALFTDGIRSLKSIAINLGQLSEENDLHDVKETINKVVDILGLVKVESIRDLDFSKIEPPQASVISIQKWADSVLRILKSAQ